MFPRSALAFLLGAGVLAHTAAASAALTDSEKGQLRSFFDSANLAAVPRMRSLAARPDLSEAEAADALSSAVREHALTPERHRFLTELLFGPASQASRATLVAPVSRALLARADFMLRGMPGSLAGFIDTEPAAFEELMRLHQFIGKAIGPEAGKGATLHNESLRSVAQAYGQHASTHAALMSHRNKAEGRGLLLRSQVALNLALLSSKLANREQVASWLGLDSVQRGMYLRTGVVLETSGTGSPERTAQVARVLEAAPAALRGLSLVLVDKVPPSHLQPSASMLAVRASLGAETPGREGWWPNRQAEAPDQAVCEAAWAVGEHLAREALRARPKVAQLADGAMQRAAGKGETTWLAPWLLASSLDRDAASAPRPVEPHAMAAASAAMLMVDAPATVDLALSRWLTGQGHAFEQMMLGMNVLAGGTGGTVLLGQPGGLGSLRTNLTVADGVVTAFELDGRSWTMERSDSGALGRLRIDGREPGRWALSSAAATLTAAERWSGAGREWTRLSGAPRAAALEDGRFVLAASSVDAADAVQFKVPAADHELAASIRLDSGEAALVARASATDGGYSGVLLRLSCASASEAGCTARLVQLEQAAEQQLAAATPIGPQPSKGFEVRLAVAGKQVRAVVGTLELKGETTLPQKGGAGAVAVGKGGRIEVRDLRTQAAGQHGPVGPRR